MLIKRLILAMLLGKSASYREISRLLTSPTHPDNYSAPSSNRKKDFDKYAYVVMGRLRAEGLVTLDDKKVWHITTLGKKFLSIHKISVRLPRHSSQPERSETPQERCIVAFDIPEKWRRSRNWLRQELVYMGFVQLQKSVWIGDGPLDENFIRNLDLLGILRHVQIFSVQRFGTISRKRAR